MKYILLLACIVSIVGRVQAIVIVSGKYLVIEKPVYENIYVTGGEVVINAPVYGDLIVAGGTVTINDTIYHDILAAGGKIYFNGYAGDDVRCAGGKLIITKNVSGDVVAAGGNILISKRTTIRNLLLAGGEVTIDGTVKGNVKAFPGKFILNGQVLNDLECKGGDLTINGRVEGRSTLAAAGKLTIGNTADFEDEVRYWSPADNVTFHDAVKHGRAVFDPSLRIQREQWYYLGFSSALAVIWYIGMVLVMIMLLQYLFAGTMKKAGQTAYYKGWKSFGWGLAFWIGVPVAAVLAMVTIVGVPVGIILLFTYGMCAVFAGTITALATAHWLNNRTAANWGYWRMVFATLGIFVVFKILLLTPFLGLFVFSLLTCIAFGALLQNIRWRNTPTAPATGYKKEVTV